MPLAAPDERIDNAGERIYASPSVALKARWYLVSYSRRVVNADTGASTVAKLACRVQIAPPPLHEVALMTVLRQR